MGLVSLGPPYGLWSAKGSGTRRCRVALFITRCVPLDTEPAVLKSGGKPPHSKICPRQSHPTVFGRTRTIYPLPRKIAFMFFLYASTPGWP